VTVMNSPLPRVTQMIWEKASVGEVRGATRNHSGVGIGQGVGSVRVDSWTTKNRPPTVEPPSKVENDTRTPANSAISRSAPIVDIIALDLRLNFTGFPPLLIWVQVAQVEGAG
jgi:hypothetical protein